MILQRDKYYHPVVVPAGANLRVNNTNISLTPGVYYTHDSTTAPPGYTSLIQHIRYMLAATFGGAWFLEASTPSGYQVASGLRLKGVGVGTFTLDLSLTTPIIRRVLGYPADAVSVIPFVGGLISSPMSSYGAWSPGSCWDGRATLKDSVLSKQIASSSDAMEDAVRTVWRARKIRMVTYEMVYGPHVYAPRANVPELAALAYIATGDTNNALSNLWEACVETGKGVLAVYDLPDLDTIVPVGNGYETLLLGSAKAYSDMDELSSRTTIAPDLWTVRIPWIVTGGRYDL